MAVYVGTVGIHAALVDGSASNISFISQDEILDPNITETYMGEWKDDKRTGWGVAERSDGLKYEGEWQNNRKYGYGVTYFKDGTKEEGKYKNNILISSQKKKATFMLRSKMREDTRGQFRSVPDCSKAILPWADRTATARGKAEQAEIAAMNAKEDAEIARAYASQFGPDFRQGDQPQFHTVISQIDAVAHQRAQSLYGAGRRPAAANAIPDNRMRSSVTDEESFMPSGIAARIGGRLTVDDAYVADQPTGSRRHSLVPPMTDEDYAPEQFLNRHSPRQTSMRESVRSHRSSRTPEGSLTAQNAQARSANLLAPRRVDHGTTSVMAATVMEMPGESHTPGAADPQSPVPELKYTDAGSPYYAATPNPALLTPLHVNQLGTPEYMQQVVDKLSVQQNSLSARRQYHPLRTAPPPLSPINRRSTLPAAIPDPMIQIVVPPKPPRTPQSQMTTIQESRNGSTGSSLNTKTIVHSPSDTTMTTKTSLGTLPRQPSQDVPSNRSSQNAVNGSRGALGRNPALGKIPKLGSINMGASFRVSMPDIFEAATVEAPPPLSREEVSRLSSERREAVRKMKEEEERIRKNPLLFIFHPAVKLPYLLLANPRSVTSNLCEDLQKSPSLHRIPEIVEFLHFLSQTSNSPIGDGLWLNSIDRNYQSLSPESGFASTPADGPAAGIFPGATIGKTVPFPETRVLLPCPPTSLHVCNLPIVNENELIRDLLSVVHGFEGSIVKFVHDGCRFVQSREIEPHMQEMALRIAYTGWICHKLKKFCIQKRTDKVGGLCSQRMCAVVEDELQSHRKLVSLLDAKVHRDNPTTVTDSGLHSGQLTLRKFEQAVFPIRTRLDSLLNLIRGASTGKGGELLTSLLHRMAEDGDPDVRQLGGKLIAAAVEPFLIQLCQWVYSGYLHDPYHEFFVSLDHASSAESFWSDRYRISDSMIPYFLPAEVANQLFSGGKSVSFIRTHCNMRCNIPGMEVYNSEWNSESMDLVWDYQENRIKPQYLRSLCTASGIATKYVVDMLCVDHKLDLHLLALRKYFLMSRGDFIQIIMDNLRDRLDQPTVNVMYSANLTATLYEAINMDLEEAEVIKALDTVMVSVRSDTEIGWDAFSLEYRITGPLINVLTKHAINRYKRIFSHLWRIKRAEYLLCALWRRELKPKAGASNFSGMEALCHETNLMMHRMLQFIRQMQFCFDLDVLQLGWNKEIIADNLKAAKSIDDLLAFHNAALNAMEDKCFLRESKNLPSNCADYLRVILDHIVAFEGLFDEVEDCLYRSDLDDESMENIVFRKAHTVSQLHAKFTRDVAQFTSQWELYDTDCSVRCQLDYNSNYMDSDKKVRNQEALNAAGFANSFSSVMENPSQFDAF
ncbi:LOW QUALITY PROTEIN: spindle pole body component 97-like [Paramacrobiotus metropolitanus]|uniref:LOW QUALITY PROTEIN: spindle pole body component 97-like n=1 Tax=Paramacrobiotus metropolitanus TaxID=2943436 RepID=UPI002445F561|nr:LOW QUALITY PROTEIN: spindle pole body component 97-like [Paramacrobiotus metropolitanus]